jgi:hypothetical protein
LSPCPAARLLPAKFRPGTAGGGGGFAEHHQKPKEVKPPNTLFFCKNTTCSYKKQTVMRATYAVAVALMTVSMCSAAWFCAYDYSSDDCSGAVESAECWHDGECTQNQGNEHHMYMCEPSFTEVSDYLYFEHYVYGCDAKSASKTIMQVPSKCQSLGGAGGTFNFNCSLTNDTSPHLIPGSRARKF